MIFRRSPSPETSASTATGAFASIRNGHGLVAPRARVVPEIVDVSMLEALQMTFVTAPTLMARFPGGRPSRRGDG